MGDVVKFPSMLPMVINPLKDLVTCDTPRAIDYALAAERQLSRIISHGTYSNSREYELALMVALGNLDSSIMVLERIKKQAETVLEEVRSYDKATH